MNKLLPALALALLSLPACNDKSGGDAATSSAAPGAAASAAPTAVTVAVVSCDAVIAHVATLDAKMDDTGKKLFGALCEGEPQSVRACMVSAATMKDLDACDPHPFKGAAKAGAGPELTAPDLVDVDLSSADPAWKGWAAKGPKDATVMADGVHGARIAAKRVDAFDISFAPRKTKMADTKKGVQTGAKIMGDGVKITFVTDSADKLAWTTEVSGSKVWRLSMNMKVSGKDVTCTSGTMGAGTESLNALFETACLSLHKK
jgi:hypothetical protein